MDTTQALKIWAYLESDRCKMHKLEGDAIVIQILFNNRWVSLFPVSLAIEQLAICQYAVQEAIKSKDWYYYQSHKTCGSKYLSYQAQVFGDKHLADSWLWGTAFDAEPGSALLQAYVKYQIIQDERYPMWQKLANYTLAAAFWNSWENLFDSESEEVMITEDEWRQLTHTYFSGKNICQTFEPMLEAYEINLSSFRPINLILDICQFIDNEWEGKFSIDKLYQYNRAAAERCIAAQFGCGISATDDEKVEEYLTQLGIKEPIHPKGYSDPEEAWKLVVRMQERIVEEREDLEVDC